MNFSILILGSPHSTPSVESALQFTRAALDTGHGIFRVFFFHDAVHTGNGYTITPQDQISLPGAWQTLGREHQLDMVLCVSSALRRGVIDRDEAARYELTGDNCLDGFALSGLGQWVEAILKSDRVISFGG